MSSSTVVFLAFDKLMNGVLSIKTLNTLVKPEYVYEITESKDTSVIYVLMRNFAGSAIVTVDVKTKNLIEFWQFSESNHTTLQVRNGFIHLGGQRLDSRTVSGKAMYTKSILSGIDFFSGAMQLTFQPTYIFGKSYLTG